MYITQRGVPRRSARWVSLKTLSAACLVVSIAAAVGSVTNIIDALKLFVPMWMNARTANVDRQSSSSTSSQA
ncbi:hypothetical protein ABZP36_012698 [Zizania latifolia]